MKIQHAQPEAFSKMIAGEASKEETKAIVRHLLAGCGRCIQQSAAAQKEAETQEWSYDQAFARLESFLDGAVEEQPAARAVYAMRH
ncbi:MAG TPA: hypothetical protein VGR07_09840 [Thermoanaerobaculia bacterium]|jgi:hypothetical protein|nr:hypothetical protein [Thermoanaerobaculia bacterium]